MEGGSTDKYFQTHTTEGCLSTCATSLFIQSGNDELLVEWTVPMIEAARLVQNILLCSFAAPALLSHKNEVAGVKWFF